MCWSQCLVTSLFLFKPVKIASQKPHFALLDFSEPAQYGPIKRRYVTLLQQKQGFQESVVDNTRSIGELSVFLTSKLCNRVYFNSIDVSKFLRSFEFFSGPFVRIDFQNW